MDNKNNRNVVSNADKKQFSIDLQPNEYIKIGKDHKENYGPFSMIGVMTRMETTNINQDIFDLLLKVSKSAMQLFNQLKLRVDPYTNMTCYPCPDPTHSKRNIYNRCMKELKDVGIVKKAKTTDLLNPVEKYTYMLNPSLIRCREYDRALQVWEIL